METFSSIERRASKRAGGRSQLEKLLPKPKSPRALARLRDARCLAAITKAIFSAGFQPRIVEHMWPGIEDAFDGFDPPRVARSSDARLQRLLDDERVIRHEAKLKAIRDCARFVVIASAEHGGFGKMVGRWPTSDIVGLWDEFRRRGRWLGWATTSRALAELGKDTFVIGQAVADALVKQGVVDKPPTARRDLAAVQRAFNRWAEQSGRPMCQVSKILALAE